MLKIFLIILLGYMVSGENKTIRPGAVWPDNNGIHINAHGGGIIHHENRYYWFGEHKVEGEKGNKAWVGVHCYSSDNLVDWKDEGIALEVVKNQPGHDLSEGCIVERPKVIFNKKTGKFVMWFHLELKDRGYDTALSGVAVSDKVTGPFRYVHSLRPNAGHWPLNVQEFHKEPVSPEVKEKYCGGLGCLPEHPDSLNLLGRDFIKGQMARDQNLFLDDDGKAYHIYSSEENSTLHISMLSDDFLSCSGRYIRVFPNRYMEAPALFKKGSTYYLIASDCTGWEPNAARIASAPSLFGPWKESENPCKGRDAEKTFYSQSTFVLPFEGKKDAFLFMADRWNPENAIDGRYVWLPVQFDENGEPYLEWMDEWDLSFFD